MGTRERRERERRRRRQEILDGARKLFWTYGYNNTTMPRIAQAAELAPGTLYLYFPSKSALYAELLIEGYEKFLPRLQSTIDTAAPPPRQAEALVDAFFDFARDCPEYFNIIFFLLQQEGRGPRQERLDTELVRRLQARENACKAIAERVLRVLHPRPDGSLRARVDTLWSMLAGVIFFFRGDPPELFDRLAREAKALMLRALCPARSLVAAGAREAPS
jgi:AcrR family transcriptional regulator